MTPEKVPLSRSRENSCGTTHCLIKFLNGMIGPGCFSVAMAFKQGGLWTAFVLVFVIGTLSAFAMHKIVRCSQYLSRVNGSDYLDYGDMAEAAFGHSIYPILVRHKHKAKYFVNGCVLAFQLGVASVAYLFVVEHVKEILDFFEVSTRPSTKELLLFYAIPTILINFVRSIHSLTIELFTAEHNWRDLPWITDFSGVVACAGSLLYSFEGQAMVLPLENKLRHPQDMLGFTGVLGTGMSLVTIVYTYCGFFGYITFGNAVEGSVTLNLPNSSVNIVIKFLLIFVVFFGNVLQVHVIIEMIWPKISKTLRKRRWQSGIVLAMEYSFRASVVSFAMLWAIAIPNLHDIIPFVGITAGMLLSLIIPSIMDIIVFHPLSGSFAQKLWILSHNVLLVMIGAFFLISGLQTRISSLVNKVQ
ncbi:hypothetical protein Q1695_009944 [Nippostrongylus brasiliensis]|nr:hypothetical protein Q1695_009944 [Nippostrongylus brasiliensis]